MNTNLRDEYSKYKLGENAWLDESIAGDKPFGRSYPITWVTREYRACAVVDCLFQQQFDIDNEDHMRTFSLAYDYFTDGINNGDSLADCKKFVQFEHEAYKIHKGQELLYADVYKEHALEIEVAAFVMPSIPIPAIQLAGRGLGLLAFCSNVAIQTGLISPTPEYKISKQVLLDCCPNLDKLNSSELNALYNATLKDLDENAGSFLLEKLNACHDKEKQEIRNKNEIVAKESASNTNCQVSKDPILQNIIKLEVKSADLAKKCDARPLSDDTPITDLPSVEECNDFVKDVDALSKEAIKTSNKWKVDDEFLAKSFNFARNVAEVIIQNLRAKNQDKQAEYQHELILKEWENSNEKNQNKSCSYIAPHDIDLFALHISQSNDLAGTLVNIHLYAEEYRQSIIKLQERINFLNSRQKDNQQLSKDIYKNDKQYLKMLEEARLAKKKAAAWLSRLGTVLNIAAAVVAFVPGLNVAVATTAQLARTGAQVAAINLAATGANLGAEGLNGNADSIARKQQTRINESYQLQEMLSNISAMNQNEIDRNEAQLIEHQISLLSDKYQLLGPQYREQLGDAIKRNADTIGKWEERLSELQIKIDETTDKRDAYKKVKNELANKGVKLAGIKLKGIKTQSQNELAHKEQQKQAELESYNKEQGDLEIAKKNLEDLKAVSEKALEYDEVVKSIRDYTEEVIFREAQRYDFDRVLDENGKPTEELSDLGKVQSEMRVSFSRYNNERNKEREAALSLLHASQSFCSELEAFTKTEKPLIMMSQFGEQAYQLYDRSSHFWDMGIPAFNNFWRSTQEENANFLSVISSIHKYELITNFITPCFQLFTSALTVYRLGEMLANGERPQSEISWLKDFTNKCFIEQSQYFQESMEKLTCYLQYNFDHQNLEISGLYNLLNDVKDEIIAEIKKEGFESSKRDHDKLWTDYKNRIYKIRLKLEESQKLCLKNLNNKKFEEQKKLLLDYLHQLCSKNICDHTLNGKSDAIDDLTNEIKPGTLPFMSLFPELFTGLFAKKINEKSQLIEAPNVVLLKEVKKSYRGISAWLNLKQHQKLKKDKDISFALTTLEKQLNAQKCILKNLVSQTEIFFYREAKNAENSCLAYIVAIINDYENRCKSYLQQIVSGQSINNISLLESLKKQSVCGEKYILIEQLQEAKLLPKEEPLKLFWFSRKKTVTPLFEGLNFLFNTFTSPTLLVTRSYDAITNLLSREVEVLSDSEIRKKEFYKKCESKMIDLMQKPLKELPLKAQFIDEIALEGFKKSFEDLRELTYWYEFSNKTNTLHYLSRKCKYEERKSNLGENVLNTNSLVITIYPINLAFNEGHNIHRIYRNRIELLAFEIIFNFQTLQHDLSCSMDSAIQNSHLQKIKTFDRITQEMKINEDKLLTDYSEWLTKGSKASKDNNFCELSKEGATIASLDEKLLPLILPNALLKEIEGILFPEIFKMMVNYKVVLIPAFDFNLDKSKEKYVLTLHYDLAYNQERMAFCSFDLATFDKPSVDCFKKVSFIKSRQKEELNNSDRLDPYYVLIDDYYYDYEIGQAHIQEFILQAMYAGVYQVPLPGNGTVKLQGIDLYLPNPQKFDGLFKLWQKQGRTISYQCQEELRNQTDYFGAPFRVQYHSEYLTKRASLLKNKQAKKEDAKLQKLISKYEESYLLYKGMCKLQNTFDKTKQGKLNEFLYSSDREELILDFYLQKFVELPQKVLPAKVVEPVTVNNDLTLKGLQNFGNTCYMNASLQLINNIPTLRKSIQQLDENHKLNALKQIFSNPTDIKTFITTLKKEFVDDHAQHDAQEFLSFLLENLGWESVITKDFAISENVEQEYKAATHESMLQVGINKHSDFQKILDGYYNENMENAKHPISQAQVAWSRKTKMETSPQYCMVQIKRFLNNQEKDHTEINFPLNDGFVTLECKNNNDKYEPVKYKITGAINHIGGTIHNGHYVAYVKTDEKWLCCNDDNISLVTSLDALKSNAYMILLEKM